jgi:large subunit ribosomal protein L23
MRSPYDIIKRRYLTEKAAVLSKLKDSDSNRCVSRCETPKYIFVVDSGANKHEIGEAIERIYADKNVRVLSVNTLMVKPKMRNRRGRMNPGKRSGFKKAIVTLAAGNSIE